MYHLPKIEIPHDTSKIIELIQILEQQLQKDISEKDKLIHQQAISDLKDALKNLIKNNQI